MILTGFVIGLLISGGITSLLRKVWMILSIMFLFPAVLWSFYREGVEVIFELGPLLMTTEGLKYGIAMGFRLDGMLMAGLILLGTTSIEDFTAGLNKMGVPYRISFALSLAFRLVPLFFYNYSLIEQAQRSRGLNVKDGMIFRRIRKSIPLLIPVLVNGIRQSDQLAVALESKGFGAFSRRTRMEPLTFGKSDYLVISLITAAIAAMAIWWFWNRGWI